MTGSVSKNALIVAFHFPPDGAVGARRSEKFAKYLPKFGWTPHVLTAQERFYDRIEDAPGISASCTVTRTGMIRNPMYWRVVKQPAELIPRERVSNRRLLNASPAAKPEWKRIIHSLLWMPDDKQGWLPYAVVGGLRVMRARPIDCIYSSGPPWTGHLVGLALHIASGLPWAADFRDPWSTYRFKPPFATSRISEGTEIILRGMVYRKARAIICNTTQAEEQIRKLHPDISGKLVTITNGFDPDDAPRRCDRGPVSRRKVFVHTGALLRDRDPGGFMAALYSLISDGSLDPRRIRVDFIGTCEVASSNTRSLMDRLSKLGVLNEMGVMSRSECLRALANADACLLLDMDRPTQVPAKLYDYMLARTPILAITEPGSPVAGIVERTRSGIIADCGSQEAMRAGILRMLDSVVEFVPNESQLAEFDFTRLTARLADVFDRISGGAR